MVSCSRMTPASRESALPLLRSFLNEDEHYLDSSAAYGHGGDAALHDALDLFLNRPEMGFVWLAYKEEEAIGVCVVSYAISTSIGGVVAKLDDVFIASEKRSAGAGSEMIRQLKDELRSRGILRIDIGVHVRNGAGRRFYERLGFVPLNEERMAALLTS